MPAIKGETRMKGFWGLGAVVALAIAATAAAATPAAANDQLRVGNPSPQAFPFIPFEIGLRKGFFTQNGIDAQRVDLSGGAQLHQAMAAGALDIALGGGPDLAFVAKGAPEIGVAAMAGPPLFLGIIVGYDSPIKTAADLKGKTIGVPNGALLQWLTKKLMQNEGWGPADLTQVTVGGDWPSEIAPLVTHQIDAVESAAALGFQLETTKQGRLLMTTGDIVHVFLQHVIFASNKIVAENPDAVRRFLKSWFQTIAFMRANKAETVEIARSVTKFSPEVESKEYDLVMPMMLDDGHFPAAGLAVLQGSFIDMGLLDTKPDMSKLYTEALLPTQ
jgi:ABC-type nitrate/sulfonate/bicarbonate transport system substrate-binding protein